MLADFVSLAVYLDDGSMMEANEGLSIDTFLRVTPTLFRQETR